MQNTPRIQNVPNTLITNFFVAGLHAETLLESIKNNKQFNLDAEILFHMYGPRHLANQYLQYIFPQKITIEYKAQDPKFFSFMMTDDRGFNSFFHTLQFYEEINDAEVERGTLDIDGIVKASHLKQELNRKPSKHSEKKGTDGTQLNSKDTVKKPVIDMNESIFSNINERQLMRATRLDRKRPLINALNVAKKDVKTEAKLMEAYNPTEENRETIYKMLRDGKLQKEGDTGKKHELQRLKDTEMRSKMQILQEQIKYNPSPMMEASRRQSTASQMDISQNNQKNNGPIEKAQSLHYSRPTAFGKLDNMKNQTNNQMLRSVLNPVGGSAGTAKDLPSIQALAILQPQNGVQLTMEEHNKDMENFFQQIKTDGVTRTNHKIDERDNVFLDEAPNFDVNSNHSSSDKSPMGVGINRELYKKKRYIPVALVLVTECEYHDSFRQILLALFDMLRVLPEKKMAAGPKQKYDESMIESRKIAFADLVAHIAFLKTIPAPPFNSIYHISMLPVIQGNMIVPNQLHQFTIRESLYENLPHRSVNPIKVLFDVLDVRSIMQCWKALIFDKWLVLVSSQVSLQFLVAEGLKQLLFPMTWQNSQIIPGNDRLVDYVDCILPLIYGSNSAQQGFEYFEGLKQDMIVCDIDGSFTNCINLPQMPNEHMYIRILNQLKNTKIGCYDKAYPQYHTHGAPGGSNSNNCNNKPLYVSNSTADSQLSLAEHEDFVRQVRETFFTMLKPFLVRVEDYMDKKVKSQEARFDIYFHQADYVAHFEQMYDQYGRFAKELVKSSQFIHFCDDYFSGASELNNFQMFKAIVEARGEVVSSPCDDNWDDARGPTFLNLEQILGKKAGGNAALPKQPRWSETQPVVFNFRMPADKQKAMLFERIELNIERLMRDREGSNMDWEIGDRQTISQFIQNKGEFRYHEIIEDIRKAFTAGLSRCKVNNNQYLNLANWQSPRKAQDQKGPNSPHSERFQNYGHTFGKQTSAVNLRLNNIIKIEIEEAVDEVNNNGYFDRAEFQETNRETLGENLPTMLPVLTKQLTSKHPPQAPLGINANESILLHTSMTTGLNADQQYFIDQEYKRVRMCHKRISRLMYGRNGFITFMHHLFALFDEFDMKDNVNYYFALDQQVRDMEKYEQTSRKLAKEKIKNRSIEEEDEHFLDQSKEEEKLSPIMQFGTNDPILIDASSQGAKGNQHKYSMSQYSAATVVAFRNETEWFSVREWYNSNEESTLNTCQKLRRSTQYVTFKTKIIEEFECMEDGYAKVWCELFKMYPADQPRSFKLFPQLKFLHIWENFTSVQQNHWMTYYCQKQFKTPQISMISKIFYRHKQSIASFSDASTTISSSTDFLQRQNSGSSKAQQFHINEEASIRQSSTKKTWIEKKQEQKERDLKIKQEVLLQQALMKNQTQDSAKNTQRMQTACSDKLTQEDILSDNPISKKIQEKAGSGKKKGGFLDLFKSKKNQDKKHTHAETQNLVITHAHSSNDIPRFIEQNNILQQHKTVGRHDTVHNVTSNFDFMKTPKEPDQFHDAVDSQKYILLSDADKIAQHLIEKIKTFWRLNTSNIERGKFRFNEQSLPGIVDELNKYDKYFDQLKIRIYCLPTEAEIGNLKLTDVQDNQRMSFLLNIFNFVVLYQLAVLFVSSPEAVQSLKKYNMWHYFLSHATINLGGNKVSALWILQRGLRSSLISEHNNAHFLLEQKDKAGYKSLINQREEEQQLIDLMVKKPHPLLSFGVFFPLKGWINLIKFNAKDVQMLLRHQTGDYLLKKIQVKADNNVIIMPKCVEWHIKQLSLPRQQNGKVHSEEVQLLRGIHNYAFSEGTSKNRVSPLTEILKRVDNCKQFTGIEIIYKPFCWEIKPNLFGEIMTFNHTKANNTTTSTQL